MLQGHDPNFMRHKKNKPNFNQSEPEFLISCLDRHPDWAVIICLVGGGQEINTGEAGISEWIDSLNRSFPNLHIHVSSRLTASEYGAGPVLGSLPSHSHVAFQDELHLSVSMRSFRTEHVSLLVKQLLDLHLEDARKTLGKVESKYPIVITRNLWWCPVSVERQGRPPIPPESRRGPSSRLPSPACAGGIPTPGRPAGACGRASRSCS